MGISSYRGMGYQVIEAWGYQVIEAWDIKLLLSACISFTSCSKLVSRLGIDTKVPSI